MKNLNITIKILVVLLIVLTVYGVVDFRDSMVRDSTLVSIDPVKTVSGKIINLKKNVYTSELCYEGVQIGDTVIVKFERSQNPWNDLYYYKVVSPKEELDAYKSGKKFESDSKISYQKMLVVSTDNSKLF